MAKIYKIGEHTIEFRDGSSTLNPWSSEYCSHIGLSLVCTSDLTPYMMVDGEKIYHLRRTWSKHMDLIDALENEAVVVTWEYVRTTFGELFDEFVGNFSEMKVRLNEAKREEDEFKKLSPKEKKKRIDEWRAKRKAEIEKMKEEKQN